MKKIFTSLFALGWSLNFLNAQVINDSVVTGTGYAQNVWYSFENDEQASSNNSNWDIAFSTSLGQNNDLTTAILFNHKIGSLYEIPNSSPTSFNTADSAGLSNWNPLFNSDTTWSKGAFNNTVYLGNFDYGWGTYDMATHSGINANRVFIIKYTDGTCKKLMINLSFSSSSYTLTYADLDNSNLETETVNVTPYTTKNFIYFSLSNGIIDREPMSTSWDIQFLQYTSFDYNPTYIVAGIFSNVGVEVAKVYPVSNTATFNDWGSQIFSNQINSIGYDWKAFSNGWTIADSTVYFVKDKEGSIWKLIMTGFGGTSTGKYNFSKEKISSVGLAEIAQPSLFIYPNPATDMLNVLVNNSLEGSFKLLNEFGASVFESEKITDTFSTVSISTSNLSNGTYFLIFQSSTTQITQKIIVIH